MSQESPERLESCNKQESPESDESCNDQSEQSDGGVEDNEPSHTERSDTVRGTHTLYDMALYIYRCKKIPIDTQSDGLQFSSATGVSPRETICYFCKGCLPQATTYTACAVILDTTYIQYGKHV